MLSQFGQWSHAVAAVLFAAVAIWAARRSMAERESQAMVLACFGTSAWALSVALVGYDSVAAQTIEPMRNAAWLGFLYALWRQGNGEGRAASLGALYLILLAIFILETCLAVLPYGFPSGARLADTVFLTATALRMISTIGCLVVLHNLYNAAKVDARAALRLPLVGLAALWFYDLNLHTVAYLTNGQPHDLLMMRGGLAVLAAPVFGLAVIRTQSWSIRLSRSMAFQSLGLVALSFYMLAMILVTAGLNLLGGEEARIAQILFVAGASLAALLLLPSKQFRAWFRVKLSKHLFKHRYDYRAEWLRFTDTLGHTGDEATQLGERATKAIAEIVEAPGGLLLTPEAGGGLVVRAQWNWQPDLPPALPMSEETANWFAQSGRIIECDAYRRDEPADEVEARHVPQWVVSEEQAWVFVPLVHFDRLVGLVLLERPATNRLLDWEDFDLLRVVTRQAASYLAEARGQEALSDVQRFDEFNRRFAFIMHDIKNLVSQLSLVTRNAERHADNPEFRADMIATLKNSTDRMNDLLARLSQHNKGKADEPRAVAAGALAEGVAASRRSQHPVVIAGDAALCVMADPARLEQAMTHLVQNAIEASPANEPVSIILQARGNEGQIEIIDRGSGMSAAFVRDQLFRPFKSTKEGGFGIGAYEARSLIAGMGGRLEVESREHHGSRFTLTLPLAHDQPLADASHKAIAA